MTERANPKIVFVYNADSGVFNLLTDIAHKMFSPTTYACNLCAITHSNFGMRREWKEYLDSLPHPLEFLHADEFRSKYKLEKTRLPAIFIEENGALKQIASAAQINASKSIAELNSLINNGLNN
jgi:hypothetical protein